MYAFNGLCFTTVSSARRMSECTWQRLGAISFVPKHRPHDKLNHANINALSNQLVPMLQLHTRRKSIGIRKAKQSKQLKRGEQPNRAGVDGRHICRPFDVAATAAGSMKQASATFVERFAICACKAVRCTIVSTNVA